MAVRRVCSSLRRTQVSVRCLSSVDKMQDNLDLLAAQARTDEGAAPHLVVKESTHGFFHGMQCEITMASGPVGTRSSDFAKRACRVQDHDFTLYYVIRPHQQWGPGSCGKSGRGWLIGVTT